MILPDALIKEIEDNDFTVSREDGIGNVYEFGKYSPEGQDFSFSVDTEDNIDYFLENIRAAYCDFDVSEEASFWLDEDGHGQNGAPYDMKDLYEDMECCQDYIMELYHIVDNYRKEKSVA